ncbi:MAG TPA: transporter [Verrucomicrobiae bacterium]|nr:transporter [Verrucomicrobiae bacterium]
MKRLSILSLLLGYGFVVAPSVGEEINRRPIEGIADNSFFVEEAYNQEPGVVQHIMTALYHTSKRSIDEGVWELGFTQEWPVFSQDHQFSYTVPYHFLNGRTDQHGIGDVQLDYRYQLLFDETSLLALSPRAGIILPTGDADRGLGEDAVGFEVNVPFSMALGDRWYAHLNVGTTLIPDAQSADRRDLWHYNVGASAIYAISSDLHLMLEWVGGWEQSARTSGRLAHRYSHVISPGVRKAFNFQNGAQCVAGFAIPFGLNRAAPDIGAFVYVSFEHALKRPE